VTRLEPHADGVDLLLEAEELEVLTSLLEGLAARIAAADADVNDPVIERFTSTVSHGDEDVDTELRQLLRGDLLERRDARLRAVSALLATAGPAAAEDADLSIHLTWELARDVIQALNDVRLALGASIDIEAFDRDELTHEDPRQPTLHLMDGLAWLQGALIELLDH